MRERESVAATGPSQPAITSVTGTPEPMTIGLRSLTLRRSCAERFVSKIVIFVFYIFASLQLFLSYKSLLSGIEYLRYFKLQIAAPLPEFSPFATVIAPCKGREDGLRSNLEPLVSQNYPSYEVIFVVDDADDPAVEVIKAVGSEAATVSKLVVAPKAADSGQKVANLREAVLHSDDASEVYVFVDSDARPDENWLASLVAPLQDPAIGAATGYRWFVTEKFSLAGQIRSVWNASIASALGADMKTNFCWGGSTAIRRETFETLAVREKWQGALSDDFALTRILKAAGLSIRFVPKAVVPSFGECSFAELLAFTNRQMKITQVYSQNLWLQSLLGSGLYSVVLIWSLCILLVQPLISAAWCVALLVLLSMTLLGTAKARLRFSAVSLVLDPGPSGHLPSHLTFWLVTPFIFLLNSAVALFSRRIRWRGVTYEMVSPTETRVLERQ